jgi:hypothetical protein
MKPIPSGTKICNECRHLYYKWKDDNSEWFNLLEQLESNAVGPKEEPMSPVYALRTFSLLAIRFSAKNEGINLEVTSVGCQTMEDSLSAITMVTNDVVKVQFNVTCSSHQ